MAVHYRTPKRYRSLPVQAKRGVGDAPGTEKYSCSSCRIDYTIREGFKPSCPLCETIMEADALRAQLDSIVQQVALLERDLERARGESSMVDAMRQALAIADPEDVAEIKAIAYCWRDDPEKIVVQAGEVAGRCVIEMRARNRPSGQKEVFFPSSVGGVAFVETYRDLVKARGNVKAMEGYSQAIAGKLAL